MGEPRSQFDTVLEENRQLRTEVHALGNSVDTLNTLLDGLVSKSELSATVEQRQRTLERKFREDNAARELRLRDEQRAATLRNRAIYTSQVWAILVAVTVAVTVTVTLMDIHVHRGHVDPLEQRLTEIEELIDEVDATLADGMLPNLDGDRFSTSGQIPLAPAPEQRQPPIGLWFYTGMSLLILVGTAGWRVTRRRASTFDDHPLPGATEEPDEREL